MTEIAIIGAGMTGMRLGRALVAAGMSPRLFDKGRAPGGRVATRVTEFGLFDHGAPVLHGLSDEIVAGLGDAAVYLRGGIKGRSGNRALLGAWTAGLDISSGVEVTSLVRSDEGWMLATASGDQKGPFAVVACTAPAPQAARLVAPHASDIALALDAVRMVPVWTLMAGFAASPGGVLTGPAGPFMGVEARPGTGVGETWTAHLSPEATRPLLEADRSEIAPRLLEMLAEAKGLCLPRPDFLRAHRWRFAFAEKPLGRPFVALPEKGLYLGGDWTLGAQAGDAVTSAEAMAEAMLSAGA